MQTEHPADSWRQLSHIEGMADGQIVLLTTAPLEGGEPLRAVYFVAEPDPVKAEALIAAVMAPNEKVQAFGVLPEAAVKAIGLKPGDFKRSEDRRGDVNDELDEALKGTFPASDPVSLEGSLVPGTAPKKPR